MVRAREKRADGGERRDAQVVGRVVVCLEEGAAGTPGTDCGRDGADAVEPASVGEGEAEVVEVEVVHGPGPARVDELDEVDEAAEEEAEREPSHGHVVRTESAARGRDARKWVERLESERGWSGGRVRLRRGVEALEQ